MLRSTLFLGLLAVVVMAQSQCNTTDFSNLYSPQCQDAAKPYCVNVAAPGNPASPQCVECVSNCDCGLDQYCSSDPSKGVGTCQDFVPQCEAAGCQCRQLSAAQLAGLFSIFLILIKTKTKTKTKTNQKYKILNFFIDLNRSNLA